MKVFRPLFLIVGFILITSLACSFGGGGNTDPTDVPTAVVVAPTEEEEEPIEEAPTEEEEEPIEEEPTEEEEPSGSQFFTEEFDEELGSDWVLDIIGPGAEANKDKVKTEVDGGTMRFELPEKDLYVYYTYTASSYKDVRLDLRADNRGVNTNNVSLFCRNSEEGWYEWSVGSGGDWYLYAYVDGKYNTITNGGTLFLKQGKDVNEYTMICEGEKISLLVNGNEIKGGPFTERKYKLRDGTVGFNISSLKVTPVILEVDWFKISEP